MNDGEKELMKLWNLHLMKNRLVNFLVNQVEQSLLLLLFNLLLITPQKYNHQSDLKH